MKKNNSQKGLLKESINELFEQEENSSASVSDEDNLNTSNETKEETIVSEIQRMVDENQFLKGNTVDPDDLIEVGDYVLYASEDAASHILERHTNEMKPGSTFEASLDLRDVMRELLATSPSESTASMVKWLGVDVGTTVGGMGVAHASPEEVANMEDYTMPDGRKEQVKIQRGSTRAPTSEVSLITAKLGQLSNGKTALSLVTMFPGGTTVDGVTIPPSRSDFAKAGLYFVIPGTAASNSEESATADNKLNEESWEEDDPHNAMTFEPDEKEKERTRRARKEAEAFHADFERRRDVDGRDPFGRDLYESINPRRWQRLAGIIKG